MEDKTLAQALFDTFGVELDPGDTVELKHDYCGYNFVDVIVTDSYTGKKFTFECYDTEKGIFPYCR